MSDAEFVNATELGEIPTFNGSEKAKATDFANYFCSYAQLYHQKQMLADHNRMAAYHAAIMGNPQVFKDKVVMDVGTGSGILAAWAAQAGARRVYAIEYTDMAKHARSVMEANGLSDIVTVIQGAVEDISLPLEADNLVPEDNTCTENQVVDIIISEWMGYFLLRESMLDSLIRARDKFLKPKTGLMFPSHTTMYLAPIQDEEERKISHKEYNNTMGDWFEFADATKTLYGVDMSVLEKNYEREQKEYYLLSSRWAELHTDSVLANPVVVKHLDMCTCTLADSKGILAGDRDADFDFDISGDYDEMNGPVTISGFAGWFTADFKSRTDAGGTAAPIISRPAFLSTGPENGYTHWGQQVFHLLSSIPVIKGEATRLQGSVEMTRSKDNTRLYNLRIRFKSTRRKSGEDDILMAANELELTYQIP
jgi:protein arginine N-methyltransferase 1